MTKRVGPITLDSEAADRITLLVMKEHRAYLKKELKAWEQGEYLHAEDVVNNKKLVDALDQLIKYFGG